MKPYTRESIHGQDTMDGDCRLRITEAEGIPGEQVTVKLEIFTERPVNYLEFALFFDPDALRAEGTRSVYTDPETGTPVDSDIEINIK